MIDNAVLLTYCAIVAGFVCIPGPATLMTIARTTTSGTRAGIATGAGISAGDIVHTFFAIVGISALIAASASLFTVVKIVGAAYLFWLGIKAMRTGGAPGAATVEKKCSAGKAFSQAIVAEVLNPKTALFFLAFLPQFVHPENGNVQIQLLILGIIYSGLGFVSTLFVALGASKISGFLNENAFSRKWMGKIIGCIYCGLGLRIAFQQR